uniref:Uncharacterized protein n=1 Tax=Anguilla anguilla TaxID=7936 RepID=A0A0E9X8X5_ANGAN
MKLLCCETVFLLIGRKCSQYLTRSLVLWLMAVQNLRQVLLDATFRTAVTAVFSLSFAVGVPPLYWSLFPQGFELDRHNSV